MSWHTGPDDKAAEIERLGSARRVLKNAAAAGPDVSRIPLSSPRWTGAGRLGQADRRLYARLDDGKMQATLRHVARILPEHAD